ncbi:MAG: cytochrome c biogenesis protein CcsA, partial [Actinomycetota bacterium]|nr:cytochrome c biogenesis protein CcsA [Actinomycetota bacterium]
MNPESLAQMSNVAIYSSMLTLAMAMVAFAASFASVKRRPVAVTATETTMSAGGTAVLTKPESKPAQEPGRQAANIAISLTWLAFVLLLAGVVLRGIWAERAPWGNMYEFSITAALGTLGVYLFLNLRMDLRWLGLFVVIPVLLTLGMAVTVLYTEAAQLVPALKSYWLVIHVLAAIICSGAFTLAAATAGLSLIRDRAERRAAPGTLPLGLLSSRVPDAERLRTI